MATSKKPTTTTASTKSSRSRPRHPPNARMIQNIHLVWLDGSIDEINNEDCCNSIMKLRQVVSIVDRFIDEDECIDFITDSNEEKIVMIVSETLSQIIVPAAQDIPQISSIYIFCKNKVQHEKSVKKCSKVRGVYTNITSICGELKQAAQNYDHNAVSISFVKLTDIISKQTLDTLDQSFMYTQILKEILLTIDFEQQHIDEFLTYCLEQFAGNTRQLENVDKIQKEYRHHQPIWWYTSDCFLYSMLNKALRLMEVDTIIKMGFFVQDLHNHITTLHAEQCGKQNHSDSFIVYRGQGLSQTDFDQLMKTKGGLMSFNNFLSTSVDRAVSFSFAESNQDNPDLIGVLFEITINLSISSSPFANVSNVSYYEEEEEILFSMHSVFRIGQVKQIDKSDRLWQVDLTLTSDNDPQLQALAECIQEETKGSTGWFRLGHLMMRLGQYNNAEGLYQILLKQTSNEREKPAIFNNLGEIAKQQGKYTEAITIYEKAVEILQKALPANHSNLANSYINIGDVYRNIGRYSKALSSYEKAFGIFQKTLSENHPDLAQSYSNIGLVYHDMGEYSTALLSHEKALETRQKALPANHPDLAASYNNIGLVCEKMGEYSKALSYYEETLEIYQKTLPANHPYLAASYNNIGGVYHNMGEYSKALSYHEKALEIQQNTLPATYPGLGASYINIGSLYMKTGEYSKALSSHEKALEILQKTFPAHHPDLATSYNNIGSLYYYTGEYSKALSYSEKALEIYQKTLPAHHPNLATSYNNIGSLYLNMGEHSKALSYAEKALEIYQKTLPAHHPDLATSYNNIGGMYMNMGQNSKALSYSEKAVEILQKTLPAHHPDLATAYNNIGSLYHNMGEYSKGLSYYEKALEIQQKTLPANHPDLQATRNGIQYMKKKL